MNASLALFLAAGLILLVGFIIFLVDSFRVNVWWGLAVLFLPLAPLVFLCMHWREGKRGFLTQLCAAPFLICAILLMPKPDLTLVESGTPGVPSLKSPFDAVLILQKAAQKRADSTDTASLPVSEQIPQDLTLPGVEATPPEPAPAAAVEAPVSPDEHERLMELNRRAFMDLRREFKQLVDQRGALEPGDKEAIARFNSEVNAYGERLKLAQAEKVRLARLAPR